MASTADWFYLENGLRRGPISEASLHASLAAGAIPADSLVWVEGKTDWIAASAVFGADSAMPSSAEMAASPPAPPVRSSPWLYVYLAAALLSIVLYVGINAVRFAFVLLENTWGGLVASLPLFPNDGIPMIVCLVAGVASIVLLVALFWLKRWAFYGYVAIAALSAAVYVSSGATDLAAMAGAGALLLFAALRVGGPVSGWSRLK